NKLVSLVEQLDRQAIRDAIEYAGLVTADNARLFELLTTFQVIDALREHGWDMQPFYLFEGRVHTHGSRPDGRPISLWYQTTPRAAPPPGPPAPHTRGPPPHTDPPASTNCART